MFPWSFCLSVCLFVSKWNNFNLRECFYLSDFKTHLQNISDIGRGAILNLHQYFGEQSRQKALRQEGVAKFLIFLHFFFPSPVLNGLLALFLELNKQCENPTASAGIGQKLLELCQELSSSVHCQYQKCSFLWILNVSLVSQRVQKSSENVQRPINVKYCLSMINRYLNPIIN